MMKHPLHAGAVGMVDPRTNGFDPQAILRDFDEGTVVNGVREWELVAEEKTIEVAPGVQYDAWAYNGRVPGPTLRAREGERLRDQVRERRAAPAHDPLPRHPHVADGRHPGHRRRRHRAGRVHHLRVPRHARSASTSTTATRCRSPSTSPRASTARSSSTRRPGRPEADELVMVMNGFDTNFDRANEVYAVNTVAFEYLHRPVVVRRDQLVRIYLVNTLEFDLLNSFHIHANFFDYYPTGTRLEPRDFTDTVIQGQGERGILELRFPYTGKYMFHAHVSRVRRARLDGLLRGDRLMEAATARGSRRPPWLAGVAPLAVLAVAIGLFVALDAPGLNRIGVPQESLTVERTVLKPGEIQLHVRNDGPDPRARAAGDRRTTGSPRSRRRTTTSAGSAASEIDVQYPWIEGEDYEVRLLTDTGVTIDHTITAATETPGADLGFYGLMALIGLYVGIIPVAIGMLWLPWLRGVDARWMQVPARVHDRPARVPRHRGAARGHRHREHERAGVRRRRARVARRRRRRSSRLRGSIRGCRARRPSKDEVAGWATGRRLLVAIGHRPPQPGRGARDRLRLRGRVARAGRHAGRGLRAPQHHRGARDRRAGRARADRPGRPAGAARADRRRARGAGRMDRRVGVPAGHRGAHVRRRRRRDRAGDRPDRAADPRRRPAGCCTRSPSRAC